MSGQKKSAGLKNKANSRRNARTMKTRKAGFVPRIVKRRKPKMEDTIFNPMM